MQLGFILSHSFTNYKQYLALRLNSLIEVFQFVDLQGWVKGLFIWKISLCTNPIYLITAPNSLLLWEHLRLIIFLFTTHGRQRQMSSCSLNDDAWFQLPLHFIRTLSALTLTQTYEALFSSPYPYYPRAKGQDRWRSHEPVWDLTGGLAGNNSSVFFC